MSEKEMRALDDRAYERLSAYMDDELSPEERRGVEADLAYDPALARALDDMRELAADLQAAYPLPDAAVTAPLPQPRPIGARRAPSGRPRASGRRLTAAAFAAAAALAVGFGIGTWRQAPVTGETGVAIGDVARNSVLAEVLETARIGDPAMMRAGEIVILGTFRTADGASCREFEKLAETDATLTFGVACRSSDADWRVLFAATASPQEAPDGRITPAAGPGVDAMTQLLDSLGAGPVLSADEEARLIDNDWR